MKIKAIVFDAYGTLYDVQSVADVTEEAFPGYGEIITQIWRIKQLEYSWLRSLMRRYQDFAVVTRNSLAYTLRCLGLQYDEETFAAIIDKYRHLDLYHDARIALDALKGRKLAILSNGSPEMLNALVKNSGLDEVLDATSASIRKRCSSRARRPTRRSSPNSASSRPTCCSCRRTHGMPAAPNPSASTSPGSSG